MNFCPSEAQTSQNDPSVAREPNLPSIRRTVNLPTRMEAKSDKSKKIPPNKRLFI